MGSRLRPLLALGCRRKALARNRRASQFFSRAEPGGSPEVIETIVFRHGLVSRDKFMSHQAEYLRDAGPGAKSPPREVEPGDACPEWDVGPEDPPRERWNDTGNRTKMS